jgi:hypothetical protein
MVFDIINQLTFSDEVHYMMILLQLHLPVLLAHEWMTILESSDH